MKMIAIAAILGMSLGLVPVASGAERPNVVLIVADDMAWDDCGAFGNPRVRTPNIDALLGLTRLFGRVHGLYPDPPP